MSKDLLDLTENSQPKQGRTVSGGYNGSTRGSVYIEDRTAKANRLLAVTEYIKGAGLNQDIDFLICLGDMAHQCKRGVIQLIWQQLNDIATDLNISGICAVSGNHDVASHDVDFQNGSPNSILKSLRPPFPIADPELQRAYHSDQYAVVEENDVGLVLVDTTSLIGYQGGQKADLWNKGYISDEVISGIRARIISSECSAFIIAMHHHPTRVHKLEDVETDYIENGDAFLTMLQDTGKPCFVLHGHKHFVNFRKYNDRSNSPWIFSASSLAATPYPGMQERYKCQFHILDLGLHPTSGEILGQIASWDWVAGQWEKAGSTGMTHLIGFGRQTTLDDIANKITRIVSGGGTLRGQEAFAEVPDLKYLTQDDISDLRKLLKRSHSVEMIESNGVQKFAFYSEDE